MGRFLKWIGDSRNELLKILKRCRNNECPEYRLVSRTVATAARRSDDAIKLKASPLGWKFHLYDTVGSGLVERIASGGGNYFIRQTQLR
jgi:hypothetical protein